MGISPMHCRCKSMGETPMPLKDVATLIMSQSLLVSFAIAAYNRREVLLRTLWQLQHCGLRSDAFEILVVDNASTDGTASAVTSQFPEVHLIRSRENLGSCAKNLALAQARGQYIVFLDDDSFPTCDSIERMISHFERTPSLGAAGFNVTLPDGSRECSAYPNVFIGCGVGFRREAIAQVGGLPDDYFMQAEEYDLSLRLLNAGWDVETFDDLHVAHLKTPNARVSTRTTRFDVRNNLTLIFRYFPKRWVMPFAIDWIKRFTMIATTKGHARPHWHGVMQGLARGLNNQRRAPISDVAFEQFARVDAIESLLRAAQREHGLRRVLFVDFGKNMLPYWLAARACGIEVVAIADNALGGRGWKYRGVPIVTDAQALRGNRTHSHLSPHPEEEGTKRGCELRRLSAREGTKRGFDAVVISNLSPVHASNRLAQWRRLCGDRPVIDLFEDTRRADRVANPLSCGQPLTTRDSQRPTSLAA